MPAENRRDPVLRRRSLCCCALHLCKHATGATKLRSGERKPDYAQNCRAGRQAPKVGPRAGGPARNLPAWRVDRRRRAMPQPDAGVQPTREHLCLPRARHAGACELLVHTKRDQRPGNHPLGVGRRRGARAATGATGMGDLAPLRGTYRELYLSTAEERQDRTRRDRAVPAMRRRRGRRRAVLLALDKDHQPRLRDRRAHGGAEPRARAPPARDQAGRNWWTSRPPAIRR